MLTQLYRILRKFTKDHDGAEGMYVSRISSLPEAPDVPISSLNVNISQFIDKGRKNGKNGKNKLKFARIPPKKSTF